MEFVVMFVFNLIIGFVFAMIGEKRKIGPIWAFVLTFCFGFIGIIIVLCSEKKEPEFIEMEKGGDE